MAMSFQCVRGMEIIGWSFDGSDLLACGISTDGLNRCHACMSSAPCIASWSSASMRSIRIECVGHEVLTWLVVSCGCKTLRPFRGKLLHRRSTQAGGRRSVVLRTRWRRAHCSTWIPNLSYQSPDSFLTLRRRLFFRIESHARARAGPRSSTVVSSAGEKKLHRPLRLTCHPSIVWVFCSCFWFGFGWVVPRHVEEGRETVGARVMAAIAQPTMQQVRIHASEANVAWDGRVENEEKGTCRTRSVDGAKHTPPRSKRPKRTVDEPQRHHNHGDAIRRKWGSSRLTSVDETAESMRDVADGSKRRPHASGNGTTPPTKTSGRGRRTRRNVDRLVEQEYEARGMTTTMDRVDLDVETMELQ